MRSTERRGAALVVNGTAYSKTEADELKSLLSSGTGAARAKTKSKLGQVRGEETRMGATGEGGVEGGGWRLTAVNRTQSSTAAANVEADDANEMRAMMLERQPSLRSIKTKVDQAPAASGRAGEGGNPTQASGSAKYRANEGRAMGRGVNFDMDGNTPRSGGDAEILGSIDSGTPNFFRDSTVMRDDAMGGQAVPAYALAVVGTTPGSAENGYFNNNELADLLMIVHGRNEPGYGSPGGDHDDLETPTLAQVHMLSTAPRSWDRRGSHDARAASPDISSEDTLGRKRARGSVSKKAKLKEAKRARHVTPEILSKEEEAARKMKAFSTRGSNLRTVQDTELMDSLVDVHGNPLTKEMKQLCLAHNQRAVELNNEHDTAVARGGGAAKLSELESEIHAKSRSWTHEEDALVRSLVNQHGPKKWAVIADQLVGKTQKQVYARWRDYLQPGLTTRPWAPFEESHLITIQEVIGNQWAVLARLMPGRSPNAIKNKFHATRRKFTRQAGDEDEHDDEEDE